jgi:hypothetical protein
MVHIATLNKRRGGGVGTSGVSCAKDEPRDDAYGILFEVKIIRFGKNRNIEFEWNEMGLVYFY